MKSTLLALVFVIGLLAAPTDALAKDNCGKEGKPACWPGVCSPNLLNEKGICRHPACGRDKQKACRPDKRLLPCDWGTVINPQDGICYSAQSAAERLAEIAAQETCKSVAKLFGMGQMPSMAMPILGELSKLVSGDMAKYSKGVSDFAKKNGANFKEINRIATVLKNDAAKVAALKRYMSGDNLCAKKSFDARVNDLRNLGVLPKINIASSASETRAGYSIISSAVAASQSDPVLIIWLKAAGNALYKAEVKFGLLVDFRTKVVGPIFAVAVGAATNVKVEGGAEIAFLYEPNHDVPSGVDLVIGISGGEGLGGGLAAIWNPQLGYPYGGSGNIVGELSLSPIDLGVVAEWHWVLLAKHAGGAL